MSSSCSSLNLPCQARKRHSAFTLIELLVVIAIIAILAAILFPVFAQAREKARSIACLNNCKQIGTALMMYGQDYDEALPAWDENFWSYDAGGCPHNTTAPPDGPQEMWDFKLIPYVKSGNPGSLYSPHPDSGGVWHCPDSLLDNSFRSYAVSGGYADDWNSASACNWRRPTIAEVVEPASDIFAGDSGGDPRISGGDPTSTSGEGGNSGLMDPPTDFEGYQQFYGLVSSTGTTTYGGYLDDRERPYRHYGGANYVYMDGHAKWSNPDAMWPHPTPPSATFSTVLLGQAYCAAAQYQCERQIDRDSRVAKAIAKGYPCVIN